MIRQMLKARICTCKLVSNKISLIFCFLEKKILIGGDNTDETQVIVVMTLLPP